MLAGIVATPLSMLWRRRGAANVAQSITGGNSRGAARLTVIFVTLLLVYEGSVVFRI
jgi:hypothetical protein